MTIEGSINDDELHVEAAASGGTKLEAPFFGLEPTPPFGLLVPSGPFPTTFNGSFIKKDDVCMETDTPEDEVCRAVGVQGCAIQCCEELSPDPTAECLSEQALQYLSDPSCDCVDTFNGGCRIARLTGQEESLSCL